MEDLAMCFAEISIFLTTKLYLSERKNKFKRQLGTILGSLLRGGSSLKAIGSRDFSSFCSNLIFV